jgi:hypothetical protein
MEECLRCVEWAYMLHGATAALDRCGLRFLHPAGHIIVVRKCGVAYGVIGRCVKLQ